MTMPKKFRHSPRLKDFDYIGPVAGHLTFVTRGRFPVFEQPALADLCDQAIVESSQTIGAEIIAYCVMPDHVHILVGVPEAISLERFAKHFKQLSGFRVKKETQRPAWQISYFDHLLRKEESVFDVASYIWENPMKEGLATEPADYPYSGPRHLLEQA